MKIVVILSVAQLVTTVIYFSAWDKSHVKWDSSKNSTQKMRTHTKLILVKWNGDTIWPNGCEILKIFYCPLNQHIWSIEKQKLKFGGKISMVCFIHPLSINNQTKKRKATPCCTWLIQQKCAFVIRTLFTICFLVVKNKIVFLNNY